MSIGSVTLASVRAGWVVTIALVFERFRGAARALGGSASLGRNAPRAEPSAAITSNSLIHRRTVGNDQQLPAGDIKNHRRR